MHPQLKKAYQSCLEFANSHYENFPVASIVLPRELRFPVAAIYTFARQADDIADEGNKSAEERLFELKEFEYILQAIQQGKTFTEPYWMALTHTIRHHHLPLEPFLNLLKAFQQDVLKKRYENFEELLEYCRYSANPIGRLLLKLVKLETPQNIAWSDSICTALQLVNFLQDIKSDRQERDRIYVPTDKINEYSMKARAGLEAGKPLGRTLSGRLGFELRMMIQGGERILNSPNHKLRLNKWDWIKIGIGAMICPYAKQETY